MFRNQFILLFVLLMSAFQGWTQDDIVDPVLIRLHAKMISAADSSPVQYANIINNRTHSGTITNQEGFFTIEMLNVDSLIVTSVGYLRYVVKVPYNYSGQDVLVFKMLPVNYALNEVNVQGSKTKVDLGLGTGKPVDIAPDLRGDAFNESPPLIAAFFNPVSYWQYYLSKREKRKREVRKAMILEKNWELYSKNYNKELVMKLTGLNESEADSFMIWFNAQDILPYTSNEYQIRAAIVEYFNYYVIDKSTKK